MKKSTMEMIENFKVNYPEMEYLQGNLENIIDEVVGRINKGGKILVCGNGGSASDSEHIVGELLKEFYIKRPVEGEFRENLIKEYKKDGEFMANTLQGGIPAISLVSQTGFITAYSNDADPSMVYAQQVYVYGNENDVLIGITTSGNSANVLNAAKIAKLKDMYVIGMTGETGGGLKDLSTVLLNPPAKETYRVQEYHLPLYHLICMGIENEIFGEVE